MNFIKQNKKTLIVIGTIFLLVIVNKSINIYATNVIEDELKSVTKNIDFEYDDLNYSFLSSTLTIDNISIEDGRDNLNLEELSLKLDPDELPSKNEFEKGDFVMSLSSSEMSILNLKYINRDGIIKIGESSLYLNGIFNAKEDKFTADKIELDFKDLKVSEGSEGFEVESLYLEYESENQINLLDIEESMENFQYNELDDLVLELSIENFDLSRLVTRELELDELGISSLSGEILSIYIDKSKDELEFNFDLGSEFLGDIEIESIIDSEDNPTDPMIKLEVELNNLERNFNDLLQGSKLKETKNGFELDFEGSLSEIQNAIF